MLSFLRRVDACRKHDCIPTILERLFWQISGRSNAAGVWNVAIVPVNAPEAETNWAIHFIADGAGAIFRMIAKFKWIASRTGCNVSMRQYGLMTECHSAASRYVVAARTALPRPCAGRLDSLEAEK